MDLARSRKPHPASWTAFRLRGGHTIELGLHWSPEFGERLLVKAYPKTVEKLFSDFDHLPLGESIEASDAEIVEAFARHVIELAVASAVGSPSAWNGLLPPRSTWRGSTSHRLASCGELRAIHEHDHGVEVGLRFGGVHKVASVDLFEPAVPRCSSRIGDLGLRMVVIGPPSAGRRLQRGASEGEALIKRCTFNALPISEGHEAADGERIPPL